MNRSRRRQLPGNRIAGGKKKQGEIKAAARYTA
jgi:hypothetical protein